MTLRYDDTCAACSAPVPATSKAWWDKAAKRVTCVSCRPDESTTATESVAPRLPPRLAAGAAPGTARPLPPPPTIDAGVGGISATKEYERRRAKHDARIEAKWGTGRIGRFAKFMSYEPQSTTAWAKGADGERRLALRLTNELNDIGVVLHDRKVPNTRGNIDHLVIAPSGVWIVDAKNYAGKVEKRDVGGFFSTDLRLIVGGRNRTNLVEGLRWQVEAVRAALRPIGFSEAPVRPSLCFTNSEWGLFAKPISFDATLVTWAAKLVEAIREPGPLDPSTVDLIARHLSDALPASR